MKKPFIWFVTFVMLFAGRGVSGAAECPAAAFSPAAKAALHHLDSLRAHAKVVQYHNPAANAALYYYQAFELMPSIKGRGMHNPFPNTYPLNKIGLRYLHAARKSLKLLHRAGEMPYCDWGHDFARGGWTTVLPELSKSQMLVRIALLAARFEWSRKHWNKAAQIIRDVLILSHRVGREGTIIGVLVEYDIDWTVVNTVTENLFSLPPPALNGLRKVLDQAAPPTPLAWAMVRQNHYCLIWLRRLVRKNRLRSLWRSIYLPKKPPSMPADFRRQVLASLPVITQWWHETLAAFEQPYPKAMVAIKQLYRQTKAQWRKNPQWHKNPLLSTEHRNLTMSHLLYRLQCIAFARFAMLRATVAYLHGGLAAFNKIRDPFGRGPLSLTRQRYQILLRTHLKMGYKHLNTIRFERMTVPLRAGGAGRSIKGRIKWTAGSKPPAGTHYDFNAGLSPQLSPVPYPDNWFTLSRQQKKVWRKHYWSKTPAGWSRRELNVGGWLAVYPFGPNGVFFVPAVPPGKYILNCSVLNSLASAAVTVPPAAVGVKPAPLDIGAIPIFRQANPKAGDVASPFTLRKLVGHGTLSLSQFRGKFVLLDFWDVVRGPGRTLMPRLKRIYDRFGKSGKLVIISILLYSHTYLKLVRKYLAAEKIPWQQAFIGRSGRQYSVVDDYPINSFPQLYLIGPNGRIISTNLSETDMESIITKAMKGARAGP